MAAIERNVPNAKFSFIHWEFDALEANDQWAVALIPSNEQAQARCKQVVVSPVLYKFSEFAKAFSEVRRIWG
eukprot:3344050-Alexandrium_andersonii.AAC.1